MEVDNYVIIRDVIIFFFFNLFINYKLYFFLKLFSSLVVFLKINVKRI